MKVTLQRFCISLIIVITLAFSGTGCIKLGKPGASCQLFPASSQQKATDNKTGAAAAPTPPGNQSGGQAGQSGSQVPGAAGNQPGGQAGQPPAPPGDQSGIGALPPAQPSGGGTQVITGGGGVAVANWIGTWQCGNYKLYLDQAGDQVTGWYEYQNSDIEGYATGNTLVGTWTISGVKYDFQLNQSSDAKSFSGHYRQGSSGSWQSWTCTRISSARPPSKPSSGGSQVITGGGGVAVANWIGTWQCGNYKLYLDQAGDQVTGWYEYQNSDIEGYATGNTLVGTWTISGVKYDFQLNQSSDAKSFSGHYRQGSSGSWQSWTCTRISTARPSAKPTALGEPPRAPDAVTNWSGYWMCGQWGRLILTQSGNQVTGTYSYQGGKVTGYATGNTLVGTWSEDPTHNPPDDAGDIQFTMSTDGNSFTGHWRYGSSGEWKPWNGQRQN